MKISSMSQMAPALMGFAIDINNYHTQGESIDDGIRFAINGKILTTGLFCISFCIVSSLFTLSKIGSAVSTVPC